MPRRAMSTAMLLRAPAAALGVFVVLGLVVGGVAAFGPGAAIMVGTIAALALAVLAVRARPYEAVEIAGPEPGAPEGESPAHVLVLAVEALDRRAARALRLHLDGTEAELHVVAPVVEARRPRWLTAGDDAERGVARRRMQGSVEALRAAGFSEVNGEIGPEDAELAAEDALRTFPAELVIAVAPERSRYLSRLAGRLPVPMRRIEPGEGPREG